MSRDDAYWPTDGNRRLFRRIIAAVKGNPERFESAGAALDWDYSTQAIRDRRAAELRRHRANPTHTRCSRAFRRKHPPYKETSRQLEFPATPTDVAPPPGPRQKEQDGRPIRPAITLVERLSMAWRDTFEDATSLDVLTAERRREVAMQRVLLAWLRLDPDRGSIRRISEFQELRTVPTDNGLPPPWFPDDAEPPDFDSTGA